MIFHYSKDGLKINFTISSAVLGCQLDFLPETV